MAASKVDMSLDDIIKSQKGSRGRGGARGGFRRGSGGRGTFRGGRGRGSSASRPVGFRGVRGGRIIKPGQRFAVRPSGLRTFRRGTGFRGRLNTPGGFGASRMSSGGSSGKLSISNLDYGVNDNDIKELFREFGTMTKATVNYDRSGRSLGTAEVVYASPASAKAAATHYNNVPLDGRAMKISIFGGATPIRSLTSGITPPWSSYTRYQRTGNNLRGIGFGGRRGGSGRGSGRGIGRGRGGGRGAGGRGGGRGAGGRGGGRGRGRGGRSAPPTKEDLDKQLEQYNASN